MSSFSTTTINSQKEKLREKLLKRRRALSSKAQLSAQITQRVLLLPEYLRAQSVLVYIATEDEVDTLQIIEDCLRRGKQVAAPYCFNNSLKICLIKSYSELESGSFGILEPRESLRRDLNRELRPNALDLVLVPGVGFDRAGNRLGRGGGYYDRFLASLPDIVYKLGLAFSTQLVESLPITAHDVCVDRVMTDSA